MEIVIALLGTIFLSWAISKPLMKWFHIGEMETMASMSETIRDEYTKLFLDEIEKERKV